MLSLSLLGGFGSFSDIQMSLTKTRALVFSRLLSHMYDLVQLMSSFFFIPLSTSFLHLSFDIISLFSPRLNIDS